jgi:hypothetical protein
LISEAVTFSRNPDGTYTRTGELPKGTRYVTVTSSVSTVPSISKRLHEWEAVLTRGPLKAAWYRMLAVDAPQTMTEEAKHKLADLSKKKKAAKLAEQKQFEKEDNG